MDCFTHRVGVQENRRKLFLAWSASARSCRHHIVATDWKEGRKKMKHGILSLFKLTHLVLLSVKRKARGGETNFAWVSQTENEWSKVELINLGLYCLVTRFSRRLPCAAADHPLILSFRLSYCRADATFRKEALIASKVNELRVSFLRSDWNSNGLWTSLCKALFCPKNERHHWSLRFFVPLSGNCLSSRTQNSVDARWLRGTDIFTAKVWHYVEQSCCIVKGSENRLYN